MMVMVVVWKGRTGVGGLDVREGGGGGIVSGIGGGEGLGKDGGRSRCGGWRAAGVRMGLVLLGLGAIGIVRLGQVGGRNRFGASGWHGGGSGDRGGLGASVGKVEDALLQLQQGNGVSVII